VTPEQARLQLFEACDNIRASGSGIRNATFNKRSEWIGRLIGSGLLAEREAVAELKRAGRDAGLTPGECSSTLASALRSGKARPIEPQKPDVRPEVTPQSRFMVMAEWLLIRCAVQLEGDVMSALRERRIDTYTTDLFALPPTALQQRLIGELVEEFGRPDFQHSGLAHLLPSGELDVTRFVWPEHRLGIVWRDPDGDIQTIERRHVGNGRCDTRWVFPRDRRPIWPLGYDQLERADKSRPVIIVEGPTDCIAVRLWVAKKEPMPVVVALPSALKLRPEWLPLLKDRHVTVALDADKAGEEAAAGIMAQLATMGVEAVRKVAPAKDWAEAWAKRGAARG
jgi:5S rRNA maturation endonuclease (ribonuclease M5)